MLCVQSVLIMQCFVCRALLAKMKKLEQENAQMRGSLNINTPLPYASAGQSLPHSTRHSAAMRSGGRESLSDGLDSSSLNEAASLEKKLGDAKKEYRLARCAPPVFGPYHCEDDCIHLYIVTSACRRG